MRNFYYVQTYNMQHPSIRAMLDKLGVLGIHDSLSELKVRSKHFLGFHETTAHAHEDFEKKLSRIFPVEPGQKIEAGYKVITIMNPKFAIPDQLSEMIAERFGEQHNHWDDDCCGMMFFCDAPAEEDDDEFPRTWMLKYEVFFEEDSIQLMRKNGDHAFDPAALAFQSFTSALH